MKILGKLTGLYIQDSGAVTYTQAQGERACILTVTTQTIAGAGNARGYRNQGTLRSWGISANLIMSVEMFGRLYACMKDRTYLDVMFHDDVAHKDYKGKALVARIVFAGQGNNVVQLNAVLIGSGALLLAE